LPWRPLLCSASNVVFLFFFLFLKNVLTKEKKEKISSNLHIFRFRFSSLGGQTFLFGENKSVGTKSRSDFFN
jgi:hypothetical protein